MKEFCRSRRPPETSQSIATEEAFHGTRTLGKPAVSFCLVGWLIYFTELVENLSKYVTLKTGLIDLKHTAIQLQLPICC